MLPLSLMMLTNEVSTFTFLPSFEMLKWIRDSNDAAQYLASPSMAGSSQASSSFFIISASADFSFKENRFKISGSLLDEKGMDSAT